MVWTDMIGYAGAVLMFSTFYMKKMIPLRAVGASANVVFIIYSSIAHVYPLLILHALLLPLNISRMLQMMRLIKKVQEASHQNFSINFLVPFMKSEKFKKGDVVFRRGDDADKLYYLQKGLVRLEEIGSFITDGQLIGEMGLFSPNKKRTATVVCDADTEFLTIPQNTVLQLYYQNPKFGIYLVQLIIQRFLKNIEEIKKFEENQTQVKEESKERRSAERLNFKVPVTINGTDNSGQPFSEQTQFENVSTEGAYIITQNALAKDTVLKVVTDKDSTGLEISAKVVRITKDGRDNGYGVSFVK